jgi:hypothetical protein
MMKTFTARQLNTHRQEIRNCLEREKELIIEFKDVSRKTEFKAKMTKVEDKNDNKAKE